MEGRASCWRAYAFLACAFFFVYNPAAIFGTIELELPRIDSSHKPQQTCECPFWNLTFIFLDAFLTVILFASVIPDMDSTASANSRTSMLICKIRILHIAIGEHWPHYTVCNKRDLKVAGGIATPPRWRSGSLRGCRDSPGWTPARLD